MENYHPLRDVLPVLPRDVMGKRADLECPLVWAQDSNALVCSTGMSDLALPFGLLDGFI